MTGYGEYPINSSDLCRRLLGRELVPDGDRLFVDKVRALLQRLGCPRRAGSYSPQYLVEEAMARRVADELGLPLR